MHKDWTFFDLPDADLSEMEKFAKKFQNKYKDVVIVGLGGSSLGTQAIFQALLPHAQNIHFLDNLDTVLFEKTMLRISPKKTLFIFISKSGETLETMTLFSYIVQNLYSTMQNAIIITEEKKSPLFEAAKKFNIPFFPHPKNIGGRFSVLSPVSLLPASLFGLNAQDFLTGAARMKNNSLPSRLAKFINEQYRHHRRTVVLFTYEARLQKFCEWVVQLLAESLGKKGKGITPLIAIGTKDQHSMLQLFLEGPNDKFFLFFPPGKNRFSKVIMEEMHSVQKAFKETKRPFLEIDYNSLNEENLGYLFFLMELVTAHLGEMWGINPFTQNAVERLKKRTIQI